MKTHTVLIVEDDESIRTQLKYALREEYAVVMAEDRPHALALVREHQPSLVTLDLGLPPTPDTAEEGLKALDDILAGAPRTKVVVITGNGDRENALKAVQMGAFDYHLKPVNRDELRVVLRRAANMHELQVEGDEHQRAEESATRFEDIIGNTPKMRAIFTMAIRVAKTDATVLIEGESGTGKELLARAIHSNSRRRGRPFVPINCGAIPETLLESELFGHEKGAYTGAHVQRKGKIEIAEGGTLFLDEIGEMSLPLQVKLLRFLQEREIERVGARDRIKVDVRIIAATNKDLKAEIQAGRFREDLYYRLSVVAVTVPPLREREEDVVLLANAFLRRGCQEFRRKVRFSPAALQALTTYPWPGNIRQLDNAVRRAVIMAQGPMVEPSDFGLDLPGDPATAQITLKQARSLAERQMLVDVLIRSRGNISKAAKDLGISRPTIHGLLDKHELHAREFR